MYVKLVLIIDKRQEQPIKYKKILENNDVSVLISRNLTEAFSMLNAFEPDIVMISDNRDFDVKKVIEQIRILTYNARPEIIVMSKSNHIQDKADFLDAGADDFISEPVNAKEFKSRINARLRRNLENCIFDRTLMCNAKISYKMIKRAIASKQDYAIMLTDINNLSLYKEIYGELATDKLIQTYAAIIKTAITADDYAGQIANDDFVIITEHEKAEYIADYLVRAFDAIVTRFYSKSDADRGFTFLHGDDTAEDKVKPVSVSIGIISEKYKKYTDLKQATGALIRTLKLAKTQKGSSYIMERPEITAENAILKYEKNMNILIAEPDESLSVLLETTAKLHGYNVKSVNSFDEVIETAKDFNPFVIILDAGNSDTMEGLEICEKLKTENSSLNSAVILTTTVHDKELILKSGADLYFPKPYEISVLFSRIKRFNDIFNNI